jgi:protein-tyrosine-phosphatase
MRVRLGNGPASVIRVRSAGFIGPDRPSPRFAIEEAAARGVDLRQHRATVLSHHDVRNAELVFVMEPSQVKSLRQRFPAAGTVIVLGDLDPVSDGGRMILDPVDQPRSAFAASYDRIDRCVAILARAVAG